MPTVCQELVWVLGSRIYKTDKTVLSYSFEG